MSTQRESRPTDEAAIPEKQAGRPTPTLPTPADNGTPPLHTMTPDARMIWLEAYEAGIVTGIEMGWQQADDHAAALQRTSHAVVQEIARQPTYAELCRRRGEPHRAERAEALQRERGITR